MLRVHTTVILLGAKLCSAQHAFSKPDQADFAHCVQPQIMVRPAGETDLKDRSDGDCQGWFCLLQQSFRKPYHTLQPYASQKSTHVAAWQAVLARSQTAKTDP